MNNIRSAAFALLMNWLISAGFFALLAAGLSRLIGTAKANHQHAIFLVVLVLVVVAPLFNTFLSSSHGNATQPASTLRAQVEHGSLYWPWSAGHGKDGGYLRQRLQDAVLALWSIAVLGQAIRLSRGVLRASRLRREAMPLSHMVREDLKAHMTVRGLHVSLLVSAGVDVPVTFGVFHPAIVFPRDLAATLDEQDMAAVMAHECAHIQRRDFAVLSLCELLTMPLAWHPGIRYLMSKISQTRELACDDYAAAHIGKRLSYARSLLRLASLCLHSGHAEAPVGVSVFDGDNLEDRIMRLTEVRKPLSRAGMLGLALLLGTTFGSGAVLARAMSVQAAQANAYAGTWHWMFQGKSFATMKLVPSGAGYGGTVTESKIALDDNGNLSKADPSADGAVSSITKATVEGDGLHVTVGDGDQPFEFLITLKDGTHAEIHPIGAPANMKPIQAEKTL